jgi:outer membrane protein TolC
MRFLETRQRILISCLGCLMFVAVLVLQPGCTRSQYRAAADKRSYALIASRFVDARWVLPQRAVEPNSKSRMGLPSNLDCSPKPPDDPAAAPLMYCPDGHRNTKYWSKIPTADQIESPAWLDHLPRDSSGQIPLTQELALDLALLHSREYQSQYESVYLNALTLTGNQFEFATQWSGGTGTQFTSTGSDLGGNRLLQVTERLGFGRSLAGGGQFATNVLNSFFWDFGTNSAGSNGIFVTSFTQPLLRGAFRHVRLENLTQAERDLLYEVRDFARFRRRFYLDTTSSFLSLLTQVQSIRNAKVNIESLQLNLVEHQELREMKMVAQIQVDQIFQEYQNGRLSLLAAEQDLAASLDQFKFQLGLPSWVPFQIDESLLDQFELVDSNLEAVQNETQKLYERLLQYTPTEKTRSEVPPFQVLDDAYNEYVELHERAAALLPGIKDDFQKWQSRLQETDVDRLEQSDQIDHRQQVDLADRIASTLTELGTGFEKREQFDIELRKKLEKYHDEPSVVDPAIDNKDDGSQTQRPEMVAWRALYSAIGGPLREEISNLYIAQTQIRLFLIDIDKMEINEKAAITFAHQNRLDQMNREAQVMDAFRKIEVAADALQSELNVTGQLGLGTDPSRSNAFRLDSSANTYRAGVQFDGPLNRLNERNVYRATQIAYQQASRNYVAGKDTIANEVRSSLRQIELRRLNFQITRQQLVAATRQVDQAQINIRRAIESNTNLTRDLLQSLQGLLIAKNNLIFNWIDYKIAKIRLFTVLELLYLDDNGSWLNEDFSLDQLREMIQDENYFPPELQTPGIDLTPSPEPVIPVSEGTVRPASAPTIPNDLLPPN